jgi:elongator complex protein 3
MPDSHLFRDLPSWIIIQGSMSTKSRMSRQEWEAHWAATRRPLEDLDQHREQLLAIIQEIRAADDLEPEDFNHIVRRHPFRGKQTFSKNQLVRAYRQFCADGRLLFERDTLRKLQMKPIRTISGVAPVTVLTRPAPCPGRCIFCPEVEGQPKSYLPDEPGAARAATFDFDPYKQTAGRIATFEELGHSAEKVELLILGGSWSAYPADYQEWFIRRCLDAMNGREAKSLSEAQAINETAPHRNVGLVIETRPDMITPDEIRRLRQLGVTKVQLGVQSLDDRLLSLNRRGHTVADTRMAIRLLRLAGFKIAVHWMPNLYGATPESDRADFRRLWLDPALRPDELKIYPTALLQGTELYALWQSGRYTPYAESTLVQLVADCKLMVQPYCRINRVMRDIPAHNIVEGSTKSNLRQIVQRRLAQEGKKCACIRCSEVRGRQVEPDQLRLDDLTYSTDATEEHLLRFRTPGDKLAGFLRLSLPNPDQTSVPAELLGHAIIREVHVYGPALAISADSEGEAQHVGLGEQLIQEALQVAHSAGYTRLAVIAAIGTRQYYRRHGFELGELYMSRPTDQP